MPAVGNPRIDQVNVVVADVAAASAFLSELGVAMPEMGDGWEDWAAHHVTVPTGASTDVGHGLEAPVFGVDLDSSAFARWWGGVGPNFTGVVVDIRVDERGEVDDLFAHATSIGARALKEPFDAFWGSRFAVVEGPGPLVVGLMSVPDAAHRQPSPDVADFA